MSKSQSFIKSQNDFRCLLVTKSSFFNQPDGLAILQAKCDICGKLMDLESLHSAELNFLFKVSLGKALKLELSWRKNCSLIHGKLT